MLMHVTPREVSGLQALAQHHGGSLTVNPQTGLPEANFLDDIGLGEVNKFVPAIAGAGLSFFSGGAIDPMTAAGMVGGLAGLTSGNLAEGIKAGLGAYGGASLTGALGAMGGAANANAAAQAADAGATGPLSGSAFSNAAAAPDVGAGFNAATGSFGAAKDFLKDNKYALGAVALPALMGSTEEDSGPTALKNKGYIRRYEKNPVTGALEQVEAVPVDDWGSRPAVEFGGVGKPVRYDEGGVVGINPPKVKPDPFGGGYLVFNETTQKYDHVDAGGATTPAAGLTSAGAPAVSFAAPPKRPPVMRDTNDTRTDSQKAYDYLMGVPGAKNPMLFYHDQDTGTAGPADAIAPLDLATRTGGHYVINKETGSYDWVPNPVAADAGLASLEAGRGNGSGNMAAAPQNTADVGNASGPVAEGIASLGNTVSNAGQIALGKFANFFNPLPNLTPEQAAAVPVSDAQGTPVVSVPAANPMSVDPAQAAQAASDAGLGGGNFGGSGAAAGSSTGANAGATNSGMSNSGGWGSRDAGGGTSGDGGGGGSTSGGSAAGASARGGSGFGGTGSGVGGDGGGGDGGGGDGAGSGGGRYGARGGLNRQGQFDYHMAQGGIAALAAGGLGSLGGYSDGGQLLKGPGDGVSDSIPATIGKGQPARLADGEFVVPARIVSELGNGSTEAGAKQLYAMMARIQAGRAKTTGKNQVAKNSKADRHLPA
jgi:hypothetical protein